MKLHFYVLSIESEGAGDGIARDIFTSQRQALRAMRQEAEDDYESMCADAVKYEDEKPSRSNAGLKIYGVQEWTVEGTAQAVALVCLRLLCDGASLHGGTRFAETKTGRHWNWSSVDWKPLEEENK